MANKKITELDSASNLQSTDLFVVVNGGETRKTTLADLNQAMIDNSSGAEGSCHVAATGTIDLAAGGLLTVDGIALQDGYRVLVWKQQQAQENGIYIASAGAWTRATDFSSSANVVSGSIIAVTLGTLYQKSIFQVTTVGTIDPGNTPISIERISGWQFDENSNNVFLTARSVTVGNRNAAAAIGINSLSSGTGNAAAGNYSFASGSGVKATGSNAQAMGSFTNAGGNNANAQGTETTAIGQSAHAQGTGTVASGQNAHAQGNKTEAKGSNAHAQGDNTLAGGQNAHAQGLYTSAAGSESHAGGQGGPSNRILASGIGSFNHSCNDTKQVENVTIGARGDHSAILGGFNNDIAGGANDAAILGGAVNQVLATALRSVILGGKGLRASEPDTAYANIVNILNYLTLNTTAPLASPRKDTVENNGTALLYSNNAALRHHLATVENLRIAVPINFQRTESDGGVNGKLLDNYLVNIGTAADYFPLPVNIEAVLVVDCRMTNAGATGEITLRAAGTTTDVSGSVVTVNSTTFINRQTAVPFAFTGNGSFSLFIRKASGNGQIECRSAQLILRPKF